MRRRQLSNQSFIEMVVHTLSGAHPTTVVTLNHLAWVNLVCWLP